ncbi:MAG: GAF domain-containing protein [Proteobacteria bacterium]|nr:GAF domain-containing protein [Pseudomonadota bacterium]
MKRGLFLKYVTLFVGLVTGVLVINAALDLYFVYQDNQRASIEVQREKAESAARQIEAFVRGIEQQIGWVAHPQWASLPVDQRRFDYVRLLRQVPAITELVQLDRQGHEQLRVSRLSMDVVGAGTDRSQDPAFAEAMKNKVYFGPVYFRKESEPYMTMAVAHGGRSGVTVAEVNLKLIWDVISQIKVGHEGYAYVVDQLGRLVAHPDISLVLRGTDMSKLAQVAAALAPKGSDTGPVDATNRAGVPVLSAHAAIPGLHWLVFVELPLSEAQEPVIATGLRALALLVVGLLIAGLAGALLARRMVIPIRALQAGAQRIGGGEFRHRLSVKTGDELESLAEQFNHSAEALEQSYATLEQRVEDRTRELTESLDQQTATAEILRVISESPTNVTPVLQVVANAARRFCGATDAAIVLRDGESLIGAAHEGPLTAWVGERRPLDRSSTTGRAIVDGRTIHTPDIEALDPTEYAAAIALARQHKWRANLVAPMLRDGVAIGVIVLRKTEPGAFTPRQVELLETFAAQAVIAIENVRLFTELRESLEQQTASAEVLRVISQSPTDVGPVLEAVAKAALRFCGAEDVVIGLREGDDWMAAGHEGRMPGDIGRRYALNRETAPGRAILEAHTVHFPDISALDPTEFATAQRVSREHGFNAALAAPMLREGEAIGAVVLRKAAAGAFTPRQIELLESFAAQAVIAIQNVRLFTELRESLEQQTASAEVLRVISQSPTDVQPVLDAVAAAARRVCGADNVGVILREGSEIVRAAGDAASELQETIGTRDPLDRTTVMGRAILDNQTVHVPDILALDQAAYPMGQQLARQLGFRSLLATPMLREGEAVGSLLLIKKEVGPFTPRQIQLLETFAAQAVIAIENVRLFTELRESLEQQTATAEILHVISQSPTDVGPVLAAVATAAVRFCGAEDAVIILREGNSWIGAAHEGPMPWTEQEHHPLLRDTSPGRAILDGVTVHFPDIPALDPVEFATALRMGAQWGFKAALDAPMLREGHAIGAIGLRKTEARPFTLRQIQLLEAFAAQAVIAIENVRLFTEIQEKSRQLELASQHKSQFLANMSHELRTPLNAIIGYTEMMADGLYGDIPEKAQGVLERVQSNGRHLLGLINDVLDLSKIEAGQLVLAIEEYSVADMVGTVVAATESLARTKKLALETAVAPGLPMGQGDARRLSQVLLNLVGNAIKFTDEGSVLIRAVEIGDRFEISVVDTGPGIAPEDQAKIFDEFQQVDNSSTRKKGGTGLGLSISRKIVELHGGRITVESAVGKGSTFKITIPTNATPIKDAAE